MLINSYFLNALVFIILGQWTLKCRDTVVLNYFLCFLVQSKKLGSKPSTLRNVLFPNFKHRNPLKHPTTRKSKVNKKINKKTHLFSIKLYSFLPTRQRIQATFTCHKSEKEYSWGYTKWLFKVYNFRIEKKGKQIILRSIGYLHS